MKRTLPLLALLTARTLAVENILPTAFPADRYVSITDKSPFALATPKAPPPPPPSAIFAANWYLTAVARNADGQDFVTIKAQDGAVHFSITSGEVSENGVSLASVDWSDTMGKSTAIIKKGTETAKLIFSQTEMAPAAPVPGPGRGGPRPGNFPVALPPVTVSAVPVVPVVGGGPMQPPGQEPGGRNVPPPPVFSGQQPPASGGVPSGESSRRRIRTIPSPP